MVARRYALALLSLAFASPALAAAPGMLIDGSNATLPTAENNFGVSAQVSTAQLNKTSDAALAAVTGLTTPALVAGKSYACRGHLTGTAGSAGGAQVAIVGTGLTATSVSFTAANYNGATLNALSTATSLGSAIGAATAVFTDIWIEGAIVVNAGGTLSVEFAQNAPNGTTSSVYVNSTFACVRVN